MSPETIQQVQQVLSLIHTGVVDLGSSFLVGHLIYRTVKSDKTDETGKTDKAEETVESEGSGRTESSSVVIGEQQKTQRREARRAPQNKNLEEPKATKIAKEKPRRSQTYKATRAPRMTVVNVEDQKSRQGKAVKKPKGRTLLAAR